MWRQKTRWTFAATWLLVEEQQDTRSGELRVEMLVARLRRNAALVEMLVVLILRMPKRGRCELSVESCDRCKDLREFGGG
jgi:hypothetical protein